ncbi:UDP-3-O-(3-hydroxymyristoyl)glucosamine N-acyltransferase [Snodgrassella alvi]|jgi:UDP-3-O-[3-hydroxymyristoyl] glucosamine N-acyltransferase|uniref:UDP-3-O-(3-hydroxymyristoyl)glucosamine N-acyltransferase n=1 Tax=Snodgrassella alvi TaxID=1196083 RepID=UPI000C1DDE1C|nr:UDP-3-O-(3-hydroxymyristoyl)glucosamine N-acyltransferase [Snodgrassella alvi]PIT24141.1 UDP-3-O-(3-hydroxymyristoyl)glucosamine N-acyltransferase [Snodgrassella alvi]PIT51234.1 UDP-3-O-(3-hydroxymyristoyl)glucosamine N-acyltransferase [Snodgrassella alvi]
MAVNQITATALVEQLGGQLRGDDVTITNITSLQQAEAHDISFLSNPRLRTEAIASRAGVLIVTEKSAEILSGRSLIVTDDPYLYFARVARLFHPRPQAKAGIHPSAIIAPTAQIAASCEIGAHVIIGEHCVIGENTRILAGTVIEEDCTIGNDCIIHANVTLYHGCQLGNRVELHSGCVIGADGFGFAWDKQKNEWFKIVQTGCVVLGDDVEIGANTTIDRGAIENTIIGNDAKIDNQVMIGHNGKIGAHVAIVACTGIAGSTEVGAYSVIGGAAMIGGHLNIPPKTTIGAATAVSHSIKESGYYASIFPLQKHGDWVRNAAHIRHLHEMSQKIKALEHQLAELNGKSSNQQD